MNIIGEHRINLWRDREGTLLGAPIFLTPEEVAELEAEGKVVIEAEE